MPGQDAENSTITSHLTVSLQRQNVHGATCGWQTLCPDTLFGQVTFCWATAYSAGAASAGAASTGTGLGSSFFSSEGPSPETNFSTTAFALASVP